MSKNKDLNKITVIIAGQEIDLPEDLLRAARQKIERYNAQIHRQKRLGKNPAGSRDRGFDAFAAGAEAMAAWREADRRATALQENFKQHAQDGSTTAPMPENLHPPLIAAVKNNDYNMLRALISLRCDLEEKHDNGTALYWASHHGRFHMVKLLVECGANINATTKTAISTALISGIIAAGSDDKKSRLHTKICLYLIDKGINVNMPSASKHTALMWACFYGNKAVVKAILTKRAELDLKNDKDKTAEDIATRQGYPAIVKMIENEREQRRKDAEKGALRWSVNPAKKISFK